ncbi:MAG: hypothetical protein IPJ47_02115 [Anaerolineales bacterium]|nr:hypothetical protein [Anaerolineales bacterium]
MPAQDEFPLIFEQLKIILVPYGKKLTIKIDVPGHYILDGAYSEKWKKELFFASVQIKKNYISFYLMPVYMYPDLLKTISPELKKHMQGKSCFNFKKLETGLFAELADLTKQGHERFIKENY